MGVEELVTAIQNGKDDAIEELWIQVEPFARMMADKYLEHCPEEHSSLKEDMVQQSYFSLLDAVKRFDAKQGNTFLTYFGKCLKKPFREVLLSGRGSRLEHDPLNSAISFDAPLYEDNDGTVVTLADTIADKQRGAQTAFTTCKGIEEVETDDYWKTVGAWMRDCFRKNGTEMGANILNYMLDHDCSFKDAVLALYGDDISNGRKVRSKYEYHLRETKFRFKKHWKSAKEERRKLLLDELFIGSHGLRDTGIKFFRETGMSSVEYAVIRRDEERCDK